jgi:hypothetical protein
MSRIRLSPFSTLALEGNSSETSVSENIDRRSPFAQSEFVYGVTTGTTFEIPYTFLKPTSDDVVYAHIINSNADLRIWRDPSTTQIPGVLRLCASVSALADFLLFIPRP